MKLKNIIIVYDYAFINGGAANVAIQSAIGLAEQGYNVTYFSAVGPVDSELEKSNVNIICLEMDDINHGSKLKAIKNGIWNKTVERKFIQLLICLANYESIIHVHGWVKALSPVVIKVACKRNFRIVITLHDYFILCPNGGFYNYQKQEICRYDPMSVSCVLCNCDKRNYLQKLWRVLRQLRQDIYIRNNQKIFFISISQKNEDVISGYVKSKKIFRVSNPVQLAKKRIIDCTKSKVFLYVGRLSEEKGVEMFCKAITSLKEEYDIEGVIIGDGSLLENLKNKYLDVSFRGWKSPKEVYEFIQRSRCLVLPSKWYEGAPLSIIEAMSAGLPCIVSNCTSATEIISDGESGFIFESGNINSLKEKMIAATDDNKLKLILKNLEKFDISDYSLSSHLYHLTEVYEQIISQN